MTQVFICPCGWRGRGDGGARFVRSTAPQACPRCSSDRFTVVEEMRPRVTKICSQCAGYFIGLDRSKYCERCRVGHLGYAGRAKHPKLRYEWTPGRIAYLREHYNSRIRGRCGVIASKLGFPVDHIKKQARLLGLARPWAPDRRDWTPDEEAFIREWTGVRTPERIAKHLGRGISSVVSKQKRLELGRRIRSENLTLREIELAFGTHHKAIQRWVDRGWLDAKKRGTARVNDVWEVSESALVAFIVEHPTAYRLDRVDQDWFLSFISDPDTGIAAYQRHKNRGVAA